MTWAMLSVILGLGLMHALAQPAGEAPSKLQGTWKAVKADRDGKPADDLVGHRIVFTANRFEIRSADGQRVYAGTVRFDPSARPAAIDFALSEGEPQGTVWKGIYALDGGTLSIIDNAPDPSRNRPTAFEAKSGSGYVLVRFRR